MSKPETTMPIAQLSEVWVKQGLSNKEIEEKLLFNGYDARFITELLKEISTMRNARKSTRGLTLVLIGALLCLASCILTLSHAFSGNDYTFVLYGVTTLGILIVFGGLIYIFN
jgi:hypothetical protein